MTSPRPILNCLKELIRRFDTLGPRYASLMNKVPPGSPVWSCHTLRSAPVKPNDPAAVDLCAPFANQRSYLQQDHHQEHDRVAKITSAPEWLVAAQSLNRRRSGAHLGGGIFSDIRANRAVE
jgi:hypothetical protein